MSDAKSYTVAEFCELEGMSTDMLYKLWRQGEGPRFYFIGNRRRISPEARQEWQEKRERSASKAAADAGQEARRRAMVRGAATANA